jgi:hypothetical protein
MEEQPTQPTILLMLSYEQATAIRDAVTCLGLAVDGEIDAIREVYVKEPGPDMAAAHAWMDDQVRLAYEVHAMIDQQQRPYVKRFSRWWRQVCREFEQRPR